MNFAKLRQLFSEYPHAFFVAWYVSILLVFFGFVFAGVRQTARVRPALTIVDDSGTELQKVHPSYSWEAGVLLYPIDRTFSGRESIRLPFDVVEDSTALRLLYRADGLLKPTVELYKKEKGQGGRTLLSSSVLYGTSPGFVSRMIQTPSDVVASGRYELAIRPLESWHSGGIKVALPFVCVTELCRNAYAKGWWGALSTSPFVILLMCAPLIPMVLRSLISRDFVRGGADFIVGVVLSSGLLASQFIGNSTSGLGLLFKGMSLGVALVAQLIWEWQPLLCVRSWLPIPFVMNQETRADLETTLYTFFPSRYLSQDGVASNIEGKVLALKATVEQFGFDPLALGVLLFVLVLGVLSNRTRLSPSYPAFFVMLLMLSAFVFHPTWMIPAPPEVQRFVGLLLICLIALYGTALRWLTPRSATGDFLYPQASIGDVAPFSQSQNPGLTAEAPPNVANASLFSFLRSHFIALLVCGGYVLFHASTATLPGTFNSDELNGAAPLQVLVEIIKVSPSFYAWCIGVVVGLVLLVLSARRLFGRLGDIVRPYQHAVYDLIFTSLLVVLVVFMVTRDIPRVSEFVTFRVPPLGKIVPGLIASLGPRDLEETRLVNVGITAIAGFLMYLLGTRFVNRTVALLGAVAFLFSQIVFYWGSFAYYVPTLIAMLAMTLVLFREWERVDYARTLTSVSFMLVASYLLRETSLSLISAVLVVVGAFLLYSKQHRTPDHLKAFGFLLISVLLPIALWQKYLVGSWYYFVGRTISVDEVLRLIAETDRWKLAPFAFYTTNGYWCCLLAWGGFAVALFRKQTHLLTAVMALFFLADGTISILFARMREYDGLTRFSAPYMIVGAYFIMHLLSVLGRGPVRAMLGVGMILPIVLHSHYDLESMPRVHPQDLAPLARMNGAEHGFFPEARVLDAMSEVPAKEFCAISPFALVLKTIPQISSLAFESSEKFFGDIDRIGCRHLILMTSSDPASWYSISNMVSGFEYGRNFWGDPKRFLVERGDFELERTVPYHQYDLMVFRRLASQASNKAGEGEKE